MYIQGPDTPTSTELPRMFEVRNLTSVSLNTQSTNNSKGRHTVASYHLRLHRARSVVLSGPELVEIRAAQRTFEGAYVRTALGQFSFALIVLKIFTAEFYSIGALFSVYGAGILFTSLFRRQQGKKKQQRSHKQQC